MLITKKREIPILLVLYSMLLVLYTLFVGSTRVSGILEDETDMTDMLFLRASVVVQYEDSHIGAFY